MSYALCSACRRHVRADDPACPFCATPSPARSRAAQGVRASTAPRAVRYAAGAAVAAAAAAASVSCSAGTTTDADAGADAAITDAHGDVDAMGQGSSDAVAEATPDAPADAPPDAVADAPNDACVGAPPCGPCTPCPPYGCVFPDEACDVVRA
jgi:hypothetical protein